ncbi:hypothetical protein LUZ61_017989 [Rhynchospora tenuis]|uniref:F-box domain-containing protein n=1 Tax=Rhynchospora tenuis TaxID=198213 RepID=A0AAD5Z8C7_9POAL|nr:hypothetical protein LUZ61_017989 [Rhynchospora tenuis]
MKRPSVYTRRQCSPRQTVHDLLDSSAMETFQTEPTLSSLPDDLLVTILSLLPTEIAARTSVLSRRFQHLWKASPAVYLAFPKFTFPNFRFQRFEAMANAALLSRQPSTPLLRLHLINIGPLLYRKRLSNSFISSLLTHAHSLGLRHLTLTGGMWQQDDEDIQSIVRTVFSISSLESLSISLNTLLEIVLPSATSLTHLKTLSITPRVNSAQVERLLLELCCLNHLQLSHFVMSSSAMVSLSSLTLQKLELFVITPREGTCSVGLFMPSLEFLYLENKTRLPHIHGVIPLLRKSVITLCYLLPVHVTAVTQLLNLISHVEELSLDFRETMEYPFCNLLEPVKEVSSFPNLKHLDACMCFHEYNFEAVVSLLHRSPALQSLKLLHKAKDKFAQWTEVKKKMNDWRSKLPRNVEGNYQYAYFSNLHLKENNEGFMELLNRSSISKKLKVHK